MATKTRVRSKDEAKLGERAILVKLHIGVWSATKSDKEISDAVNEDYDASEDASRVSKRLISRDALRGVNKLANIARTTHRVMTLPWTYDGTGILANRGHDNYVDTMHGIRKGFQSEVKDFLLHYPEHVKASRASRMGSMFKDEDYPTVEELKGKFAWDIEFNKVPEAGDFRVKMDSDTVKTIAADIQARTDKRVQEAMNVVFERVSNMARTMATSLRNYDPGHAGKAVQGKFRDSLVGNIVGLADSLPFFNITGDERIEKLAEELMAELAEFSPEELRADAKVRAVTIKRAEAISRKVSAYIG